MYLLSGKQRVQGRFIFENETLEEILKQLGRWYDTEIFYPPPRVAKYRFTGNVDRFDPISPPAPYDRKNISGFVYHIVIK